MSDIAAARAVRLNITINGLSVSGATSLKLFQSGNFSADRFVLSMAFNTRLSNTVGPTDRAGSLSKVN